MYIIFIIYIQVEVHIYIYNIESGVHHHERCLKNVHK